MRRLNSSLAMAICFGLAVEYAAGDGGTSDVTKLLRIMPADFATTLVAFDLEKLDKSVSGLRKRLDPNYNEPGMVADMKRDVPIGDWIDFSKPIGVGAPSFGGQEWDVVFWASVPDFAGKVKTLDNATEEEGVWRLPFNEEDTVFARIRGDYVVAALTRETLIRATKQGTSLADELRSRMNLLEKRDLLIHLNVEPVRPMLLGGIAQVSQMAPMLAMLGGQQSGADPTTITGLLTALFDAVKQFVEQIAYIDITIAVGDKTADLTIATGYKEGAIKTYLTSKKPASIPLLTQIEDQPYFVAAGYHVPGETSPFFEYLVDKVTNALQPRPAAAEAAGGAAESAPAAEKGTAAGGGTDALKEAMRVSRELYRNIEGQNMVMAMSPSGIRMSGDYIGKDPEAILELTKQSFTAANPFMQQFSAGVKYEALGSKKLGDVLVEQFAVKLDTTAPSTAIMANMYGENPRFFLGVARGRVRFCMGGDTYVERFFSGKVEKPLASGRYAAEALAALPATRNAVLLFDPAGIVPILGPMLGMPKMDPVPPGPPVAISASLAGDPARLDIHIPLRAIERFMQALEPDEPM